MGILDELLAGGQRQKEFQDFASRYDQGRPEEGYSDNEVLNRYGAVAHAVSTDDYRTSAQEALARLSPDERTAFAQMLQQRAKQQGLTLPGTGGGGALTLQGLAQLLTGLHQQPGQLRGLLTGGQSQQPSANPAGALFDNPLAKAALAGIAAMAVRRIMNRR